MLQTALATLATNQAAEAKMISTTADTVTRVEKLIADETDQALVDSVNAAAKTSLDNTTNLSALNDRLSIIAPVPAQNQTADSSTQTQGGQ